MTKEWRQAERAIDPAATGIRWFRVDEELVEHNRALAFPTRPAKTEDDMPYWQYIDEDDKRLYVHSTAEGVTAGEGQEVPCYYNPALRQWEVLRLPETNSVSYWVGKGVEGWTGSSSFPELELVSGGGGTTKTGWLGAKGKTDGEEQVGIEYLDSVSAPSTDGNFLINKTGTYRFALHGLLNVTITSGYVETNDTITTSTSSGHTHTVTVFRARTIANGPHCWFQLHRKPSGGAMATYTDDIGEGRQHWMRFFVPQNDQINQDVSTEWYAALDEGDRIALRCRLEASVPGFKLTLNSQARIYWHVSRVSDSKKVWSSIP